MMTRNWKPMLCKMLAADNARDMLKALPTNFIIEQKYDGVRATICDGKLYNRRGEEITHKFPEFRGLSHIKGEYDGEVIARSEEFNDTASRIHTKDAFKIRLLSKKCPVKFVCFDCISTGETVNAQGLKSYMPTTNLAARRKIMEEGLDWRSIMPWFELAPQLPGAEFDAAWDKVLEQGKEGLVIKQLNSTYQFGKRSDAWYKVKAWEEVEATFTKYEVQPRGITLETADGRRVVVNGAQADVVRAKLDKNGFIRAEIQHLPQADSAAWRFPSFRRLL